MFLYNKTTKDIEVYTMVSNFEKLRAYRKKEMELIPEDEKLLRSYGYAFPAIKNLQEGNTKIYLSELVFFKSFEGTTLDSFEEIRWNSFEKYDCNEENTIKKARVLNNFYNGKYTNNDISLIIDDCTSEKTTKYVVPTENYQSFLEDGIKMENILNIPKSLYFLNLLEKGEFVRLQNEDIGPQLSSFDISKNPIKRIYISELSEIYGTNLLFGNISDIEEKITVTQKILQKLK